MADERFSLRLYRHMLKLYPAGFRENYAEPLAREFRDEHNESTRAAALSILLDSPHCGLGVAVQSRFLYGWRSDVRASIGPISLLLSAELVLLIRQRAFGESCPDTKWTRS